MKTELELLKKYLIKLILLCDKMPTSFNSKEFLNLKKKAEKIDTIKKVRKNI